MAHLSNSLKKSECISFFSLKEKTKCNFKQTGHGELNLKYIFMFKMSEIYIYIQNVKKKKS